VYEGKLSRTVLRREEAGNRLVLSRRFFASSKHIHEPDWRRARSCKQCG